MRRMLELLDRPAAAAIRLPAQARPDRKDRERFLDGAEAKSETKTVQTSSRQKALTARRCRTAGVRQATRLPTPKMMGRLTMFPPAEIRLDRSAAHPPRLARQARILHSLISRYSLHQRPGGRGFAGRTAPFTSSSSCLSSRRSRVHTQEAPKGRATLPRQREEGRFLVDRHGNPRSASSGRARRSQEGRQNKHSGWQSKQANEADDGLAGQRR